MKLLSVVVAVLGVATFANVASADPKPQEKGTLYVKVIDIVGRPARPMVTTEVSRVRPELTSTELKLPVVDRIAQATSSAPF